MGGGQSSTNKNHSSNSPHSPVDKTPSNSTDHIEEEHRQVTEYTERQSELEKVNLPPPLTAEERAAFRRENNGDFHNRITDLYDMIDSAESGESDGYITFSEFRHFFQGDTEKAMYYIGIHVFFFFLIPINIYVEKVISQLAMM